MIDDRPDRNSMSIEEVTISTGTTHGSLLDRALHCCPSAALSFPQKTPGIFSFFPYRGRQKGLGHQYSSNSSVSSINSAVISVLSVSH